MISSATLIAAVLLAAPPMETARESATDWTTDEEGRTFRTGFDPGSQWQLGAGWAPIDRAQLTHGLLYRELLDYADEDVAWKMYHRILESRVTVGPDHLGVRGTLYRGQYMRWMRDGWVTIPTNPPKRVAFPMNVGIDSFAGRFTLRPDNPLIGAEIGVAHTEVVLDFWRSKAMGSYFQVGIGPTYDIWLFGELKPAGITSVEHVISPFANVSATVHHEWDRGRQLVEARVSGAAVWASSRGWGPRASASARYELTLVAINDMPLTAYAEVDYGYEHLLTGDGGQHDLRGGAGLRWGLPLVW